MISRLHCLIISSLCAAVVAVAPAQAQQFTNSASIIQALETQNTGPLVRSLNSQAKRGIAITGQLPPMVDLPSIDLTINFELDSARLSVDGMIGLRSLAKALLDPKLQNMTFQIAGHTDGRGDMVYNQTLSEKRARAVVDHLVNFYEVPADRLVPVGYGTTKPLDAQNLLNPVNRRVEIINLAPLS